MSRKKLIRTPEYVYHITSRSNNKEWFYLVRNEVWKICRDLLNRGVLEFGVEVHAFVLMSNHYHLLARFPEQPIDKFMAFFNTNFARRINQSSGRINRVFGGRYSWSLILEEHYYWNALRYVYQNPVEAKLVQRVEDYDFSSLDQTFVVNHLRRPDLNWLNRQFNSSENVSMKKGFKKKYFEPSKDRKTRKVPKGLKVKNSRTEK